MCEGPINTQLLASLLNLNSLLNVGLVRGITSANLVYNQLVN
jgi:hypothetical protein